jgi:hypothetical protein
MTSIWGRFARFFSRQRRREPPSDADVVRGYRKLFGRCPVCGLALDGHGQHRLAAALVAPPSPAAVALAEHVAERRWKEAAEIAEWRWDRDAREVHVIRCPNAPGLGLVTAHYPYWGPAVVEESRRLPDEDAEQISRIVGDRWQPL